MKRNTRLLSLCFGLVLAIISCGHPALKTKEEAIKFLESNDFYDNEAQISGRDGGNITSPFSIRFTNGQAIINTESLPFTLERIEDGMPNFNGPIYRLQFCGSSRYAYGGCIGGYLSSGIQSSGEKSKFGPALKIKGDFVNAYFSYVTKGSITKKQ